MKILGTVQTVQRATGADPASAFGAVLQGYQQAGALPEQRVAVAGPMDDGERDQLIGAARFYGVPGVEQMQPDQLRAVIEERRAARKRDGNTFTQGLIGGMAEMLAPGGSAEVGPSLALGFLNAFRDVPFIGDAMRKIEMVNRARQSLAYLEEAAVGDRIAENEAVGNLVRGAGRFTGAGFLYAAAGELVGASGFAAGIANPLVRGALQGGAAAVLTETGGSDPIQDRVARVAVGAGFGGAATWGVEKVIAKLGRSFPRPSQQAPGEAPNFATTDNLPSPYVRAVPEEDIPLAEWEFVEPFNGQNFTRVPDPALAPGPRPADPVPARSMLPTVYEGRPVGLPDGNTGVVRRTSGGWSMVEDPAGMVQWVDNQALRMPPVAGVPLGGAAQEAAALTKQATVLESPVMPAVSSQVGYTEADVAVAAINKAPGEISIVRNVSDSGELVRTLLQQRELGVGPTDFRLIPRKSAANIEATRPWSREEDSDIASAQFMATTPSGDPVIFDLVHYNRSRRLEVEDIYPRDIPPGTGGIARPQVPAGPAWTRQTIGELIRTTEEAGLPVQQIFGQRVTGARAGRSAEIQQTTVPASRFTRAPQVDLLVSDGHLISDAVVEQYSRLGFFEGQQATVPGGSLGRIRQAGSEWSMIEDQSGMVYWARNADILPGRASMMPEVPAEAYVNLRGYAHARMNEEAASAGLGEIDWFSDEMATQLPRYIGEFLDQGGVQGEALRGAYKALFTQQRVRDFRQLAPEEFTLADEIAERATREDVLVATRESRPVWLEEVAEAKGLSWVQEPGGMGGRLVNRNTGEEFALADREEGFAFLANYDVDLPDYSPIGTVPAELASSPASPGSSAGPKHNLTEVEISSEAMRSLDRLEAELAGGGDVPPFGPPSEFGEFGPAPSGPPLLPPADETIGAQLERARLTDRATYDKVLQRFDNLAMRVLDPMRNYALGIEDALVRAGFDKGVYWQHYSAISNGRAVAHNEAAPWHTALNDALGLIRRKFIRDGTVTLIGEMNENVAVDAMQKAGYTAREIEGQMRIRGLLEGLRQEYEVRQLLDYMPHLRSRAASGDDLGDLDQMFTGTGKFFAELVREGSVDVREMNAAVLLHRWVRAATFHRHVAPHIETMANAWVNDPRVPLRLREPTRDWLSLITHGHTPGQDVVVPGVRHVLNVLRIPVTNGEVARGMNWLMANMYRGALGGRVDVLMRDSIGPLFAVPRVGLAPVANAYLDFFRSGRKREAMWAIAKAKGWVESGMVPMGASEMFESGFNVGMPGNTPVNEALAPWQNTLREGVARVGDFTRDMLPPGMRSGMQGTYADPLLAYTKVGEFNRLISGWAGWSSMLQATERLAEFRMRMPDANLDNGIASALRESGAANFPAPIQRRVADLLRSQQYEEAASVFANEVANSQFRYGTAEGTALSREGGVTGFVVGKLGSTFGTFTNQYIAQMREGLTQGGLIEELGGRSSDKVRRGVKFAAGQYLSGSALAAGATATGWNLAKWFWHGSLGWGGGPMMMTGITKLLEYSGRWQQEMGENPSPMQLAAIRQGESSYPSPLTLNPYSGAMRTVEGYATAFGAAAPFETALGYTMTGRLTSPDITRQLVDPAFGIQEAPGWLQAGVQQPPSSAQPVFTEGGGAMQ